MKKKQQTTERMARYETNLLINPKPTCKIFASNMMPGGVHMECVALKSSKVVIVSCSHHITDKVTITNVIYCPIQIETSYN